MKTRTQHDIESALQALNAAKTALLSGDKKRAYDMLDRAKNYGEEAMEILGNGIRKEIKNNLTKAGRE
jgi:Cdc6-like AAA superfamily ATPase